MRPVLLLPFVCLLLVDPVCGKTLYVSKSGDGTDRTTWETALNAIGDAMAAAVSGDEIVVAIGTYFERVDFAGKNVVLRSTDPEDIAVVRETVIDANKTGSVVTFSGHEGASCILSGFTITHGQASSGGGIDGNHSNATICNNIIRDNTATGFSGGGGVVSCRGRIEGNTITRNRSVPDEEFNQGANGGGLSRCSGTIQGNTITYNRAVGTIFGTGVGGGLYWCTGLIQNNFILGNAAIDGATDDPFSFYGEGGLGGGLHLCSGRIQNNLIASNVARGDDRSYFASGAGGGLSRCSGIILGNTLYGNSADFYGGGIADCEGLMASCIVWGNSAATAEQVASSPVPLYCCIQDGTYEQESNISEPPLFVDSVEGDFRLQQDSPCVDTGLLYLYSQIHVTDLDGNCRLAGETVDMGCYEFLSSPDADGDFLADSDETIRGTNVLLPDSDGDGLFDGIEVLRGSRPDEPDSPSGLLVPSEVASIQEAIFFAFPGEALTVEPGDYKEVVRFLGRDLHLRSSDPQNASVVQQTILNGEGIRSTVSFKGRESSDCVLEGFTITNGIGGGISGGGTKASIRGNDIYGNFSREGGGIVACRGLIEANVIHHNTARKGGGIAFSFGTIRNNSIHHNIATLDFLVSSKTRQSDAINIHSTRSIPKTPPPISDGGGLWWCFGPVEQNRIYSNTSQNFGGGASLLEGTVQNNLIYDNEAELGGGLYGCSGLIRNNTIYGNRAVAQGPYSASVEGGGIAFCDRNYNNILWGNTADIGSQIHASNDPTYSLIEGWTQGGLGNISGDPLFVNAEAENFHLQPNSPCVDSGALDGPAEDFEGSVRPVDIPLVGREGAGAFDIGAYEVQVTPTPTPTASLTPLASPTPSSTDSPTRTPTETATNTAVPSDINLDGETNAMDLLILLSDWKKVSSP